MILHKELFDGEFVPLVYDLWYQYCKFFFASPVILDQSENLMNQITRHVGMVVSHNDCLSEMVFDRNPDTLGFGGIFKSTENDFFPDIPAWVADVPSTQKERIIDWPPAIQVAASLVVLFLALEYHERFNENYACKHSQTIKYGMCCRPESNGGSLWATVCPSIRQLTEGNREQAEAKARQAMLEVGQKMWPGYFSVDTRYREQGYRAYSYTGAGLYLEVPGDACSLYTDSDFFSREPGWQFSSHNIDSPIQSLSLLAGIATINRLYREAQQQT